MEELEFTQSDVENIVKQSWNDGAYSSLHNALNHIKMLRNEQPNVTIDTIIDLLTELVEVSCTIKEGRA